MKHIPLFLVLGFALSLCGLTNKLKKEVSSSGDANKSTASDNDAPAERPVPTAGQIAAISGGQTVTWDQQGMSWTVPSNWSKASEESKELLWRSPGGSDAANLIVSISPMDESFPTDISIKAFYDGAKTRAKNGEVDELKWVEIDGLKGVQFRESNPEKPDGIRRLQWLAYRKYAGQVQMINLMLSSSGKGFPQHQDAMYGILYSTKITK
ncbi:MAG: hypothetical protein ND866_23505 [Pyrinomonadaceae bacterium]|nr:hypothetical protein [Pyrinomonadaceae bacterium]